jgi:hypothetical protein
LRLRLRLLRVELVWVIGLCVCSPGDQHGSDNVACAFEHELSPVLSHDPIWSFVRPAATFISADAPHIAGMSLDQPEELALCIGVMGIGTALVLAGLYASGWPH